jgi:NADH-quinone oxidoreductase subunit G
VGALTHRKWRFNTRIWFTKETDSICPGCSTGCNVKVACRDREVVQVKARLNPEVNKEWLCDEGRYGFNRFLPENRLVAPRLKGAQTSAIMFNWKEAVADMPRWEKAASGVAFISPDLLMEEYWILKSYLEKSGINWTTALSYRERKLTPTEAILISPDYACNFRAAESSGVVAGDLQAGYEAALSELQAGKYENVFIIGERGILRDDLSEAVLAAISKAKISIGILSDASNPLINSLGAALPEKSILEKAGLLLNRKKRLQYSDRVVEAPQGPESAWSIINRLACRDGSAIVEAEQDRELTLTFLRIRSESGEPPVQIGQLKALGGLPL